MAGPIDRTERDDALGALLLQRGARRLEALLASPDPAELASRLVSAEVFFTYAELEDEGERRALVALLAPEQVGHLLDLGLWEGERLDQARALEWLDRLVGAGDEVALSWVLSAESELVVALLQGLLEVHQGPAASDIALSEAQDSLPPFTLEGVYYIHFSSKEAARPLRRILTLLASEDIEYYLAIMADLLAVPGAEIEEAALEWRWRRLRDEGLEPPDEAYEIYRWPSARELTELEREASLARESDADEPGGAPTALAIGVPGGLLAEVLEALPRAELDRLGRSVARAAGLVLSADHLPLLDLEARRAALAKTLGYVSIGLERASGGALARAAELLPVAPARLLFRLGYAEVAGLARRAVALRRRGWLDRLGLGLGVLDSPMGETVAALARPRPVLPACLASENEARDFRTRAEIELAAEVLSRAEALGALFVDGLGLTVAPDEAFELDGCVPSSAAELTLGLILRTALARLALDGELRFVPVEASRLAELPPRLVEGRGPAPTLRSEALRLLASRLEGEGAGALAHVEAFVDECLDGLVDAFEGLGGGGPVDPRFVGVVVVRDDR